MNEPVERARPCLAVASLAVAGQGADVAGDLVVSSAAVSGVVAAGVGCAEETV